MPMRMVMTERERRKRVVGEWLGRAFLLAITSVAALALLSIIAFIARDALPFFAARGLREFFLGRHWYPSHDPPQFGALPLFAGSLLVTLGAMVIALPLGVAAAVCLSDMLPFGARQVVKPVVEMLAAIPSVAYGFFALVVLAPLLQSRGAALITGAWWLLASPMLVLGAVVLGDVLTSNPARERLRQPLRLAVTLLLLLGAAALLLAGHHAFANLHIASGTNALNVSIILGAMALPTIVSVSEDALQAAGRELREGSFALGATRAETLVKVIIPAAASGILSAMLLGVLRALGETMVVWMASGNAAQIPVPWYNLLLPVRTLTATIAGDMGEADQVTGSARYHVLFAMGLCLLLFSFLCSLAAERIVARQRRRLRGG